jgi:hypothetical protein
MGAITALVGELSLRGRLQITPVTIRLLDATATDDDLLDNWAQPFARRTGIGFRPAA